MHILTKGVLTAFEAQANPELAGPMKQYMRNQFEYYGIKSPARKEIFRDYWKTHKPALAESWQTVVRELWRQDERECQYFAMDLMAKFKKSLSHIHLGLVEYLITTKSWWDTVDFLAIHFVGKILSEDEQLMMDSVERYTTSDHLWLQRTAIIFQLSYKERTHTDLLFSLIYDYRASQEFFIQKACGWALRSYSKSKPQEVKQFVDTHAQQLSTVTLREARKYL